MQVYLRLLRFVKPYWKHIVLAVICMAFLSLFTSAIAYLVKPAMDEIFLKRDLQKLILIPIVLIGLYILKGICDYWQAYLMGYVGNKVVMDIRNILYCHLNSLSVSFFTRTPTGILMSRIANDVSVLQRSVSQVITKFLRNLFLIIGLTSVAFYRDWRLASISLIILPWVFVPIVRFGKKSRRISRKRQERMGKIATILSETIVGNRIVKAYCMEDHENMRFSKENYKLFRLRLKRLKITALSRPIMELFGGLIGSAVIVYGGHKVINGSMTPGQFFSFIAAMTMQYKPVKSLNKLNQVIQEGIAAAIRVFEILDTPPEIKDKPNAIELSGFKTSIKFSQVSFAYDENEVLKDINLEIKKGERIAIVGASGAGKTTLVNLLLRFYDVTSGAILIDGIDIREITLKSLRRQIAIVTQETILFNDTIRANITYGNPHRSEEEIIEAAKAAYIHDFIVSLPDGYDTVVGEKATRLSGGQAQRLAIARAILKNAPILILDEPTSALDTQAEREVQRALNNLMEGKTTIIIAHRLSTIQDVPRIAVLSKGKIVEQGTHKELMANKGEYYYLYRSQLKEEEKVAEAGG